MHNSLATLPLQSSHQRLPHASIQEHTFLSPQENYTMLSLQTYEKRYVMYDGSFTYTPRGTQKIITVCSSFASLA